MPTALCFDMYGTLFDTASVEARLRERIDAPAALVDDIAESWRWTQLRYSYLAALMDAYRPFWDVTDAALSHTLDYYGLDLRATDVDAIMSAYEELDPFDDTVEALDRLGDGGARLAILSNGSPGMLRTLAENAGVDGYFEAIVSADEVETFKPHPAVYENAADRLDLPLSECWLVSSNAWDAAGAAQAGMGVAWVNRANEPPERIGGDPTVELGSLVDLVDEI